ncbi:MAG: DUF2254 domain-containing protein [Micavibrio sp.]
MARWLWFASSMAGYLWLRAALYGVVAVVTALAAIYLKRFIPEDWPQQIGADAVDGILNILAASMLSVTIFSLSTVVAAYGAATNNVTPRATKLLIEDKTSHNALSTFIGAFIFSIVGIVALRTGVYGESGRLILFLVTIGVIAMIILMLLRWIEYLSRLGRVNETIEKVERTVAESLEERLRNPYLGGRALQEPVPENCFYIYAQEIGYIQHIDMGALSAIAKKSACEIHVLAPPGKFVNAAIPLVAIDGVADEDMGGHVRKAFIVGTERSFREDPRFGLAVLCEIGTRALSSAINDSGTPIHVIGIGVRVLSLWAQRGEFSAGMTEPKYPAVFVPPLRIEDLFDDFFMPLARDGAGLLEVMIRLQKAYAALAATGDAELARASRHHSMLGIKRSYAALALEEDREKLASSVSPLLFPRHS